MSDFEAGRQDAQIEVLQATVGELKTLLEQVRTDVNTIKVQFAEAKGGWKVMLGVASVVGAVLGWVGAFLMKKLFGVST